MKEEFNIAFRIIIASFVTREGGKDSVPIPHRHFVWFMFRKIKINLAKMLFDHLCTCISESHNKAKVIIHHPRLISELIRQTKLIEILRTKEKLRVFNSAKLDATILVNMKLRTKEETVKIRNPLQEVCESYFWCNGFPTILEADNEEVIENFLELVRRDTGVRIERNMVAGSPWDIYKTPREVTRNKRKPITIEEDMIDEGSEERDSVEDMVDDEENVKAAAEVYAETSQSQRTETEQKDAEELEPERRTKKRHDRGPSDVEDQAHVKPFKRIKVKAHKHKGTFSKPYVNSSSVAQDKPSQPPPIPQSHNIPDMSKPISMILPDQNVTTNLLSSDSSSSSSTLSSYSYKRPNQLQNHPLNLSILLRNMPLMAILYLTILFPILLVMYIHHLP
jgi:hypothetical protein